eukprot:CAMPEP_0176494942 /NCGR_PEP_ID=MMETSP0200_2-20121128/10386_1 /TAXON_ID=947934 /ORGANISM="Chaetoceros sp., Strain GSL56" /LENGTH=272 /DNA_ID=CAMNT_0017892775 /DNA_START=24 /DNA_END=840 /DNA_ORIENTATION=-
MSKTTCFEKTNYPLYNLEKIIYHASGNSLSSNSTKNDFQHQYRIVMIGGKEYDDLKQIRLVRMLNDDSKQVITTAAAAADTDIGNSNSPTTMASICVKRNIIFGSRLYATPAQEQEQGGGGYVKTTLPLLEKALLEASREGDQPQGLAALNGLSRYVRNALQQQQQEEQFSPALELWRNRDHDAEQVVLEAITSVATQIPRKGHSVVGIGTYSDARIGWTDLAKEYATISETDETRYPFVQQGDATLFQAKGALLVNIEYIGFDENPDYWKD